VNRRVAKTKSDNRKTEEDIIKNAAEDSKKFRFGSPEAKLN
jgi:hypothetical protein